MSEGKRFVAFDLGAESGRAVVGELADERLTLDILHRFPNGPVRVGSTLYWDALGILRELKNGLAAYAGKYGSELAGVGTDSWGVDFGLLDRNGALLGNPVHYRDSRTDGMPEALFKIVPRREVFRQTGIQVMQLNTLYQLFSMVRDKSPLLDAAETMLCMADLMNYFLCGDASQEFSLATTTQMYNPVAGDWAGDLLEKVGIPSRLLPDIAAPGSVVGTLYDHIAADCGVRQAPVIAPACHDTAAAVAAVPAEGTDWLYLSSGTWSLLGAEVTQPLINEKTQQLNFTNEGGVDGTFRFLKNIMGLWLVQECRRTWEKAGKSYDYAQLAAMAEEAPAFRTMVHPNDDLFLAPGDMPARIAAFAQKTGQPVPESDGAFVRAALESLALFYRRTVESIEEVTGRTYAVIHVVGGGCQNKLLNRFTADATGKTVKAGPVEATAFGNCLLQAIALGEIGSLADARAIVRRSTALETFEPAADRGAWEEAYGRFAQLG